VLKNKALWTQIKTITTALLLTGAIFAQEPTDLFSPVEAGKGPATAQATTTEPGVLRTRLVTLDLPQLQPHAESVGEAVRFNLFDDVTAELELARATRPTLGGLHWFGRETGGTVERAVLSIVEGRTSGSLTVGSRFFRIEHVAGPIHRIEELSSEREAFGADAVVPPGAAVTEPLAKQLVKQAAEQPPTANMTSSHVIDILICYTPAGKARAGGKTQIEDRASLAIAEANSSLQNSGVTGVQWNLVATVEVSPSAPGDSSAPSEAANVTYLNYLTYDMDHVHALRDQYGADIVSLWINNASSGTIGIGWIMPDLAVQYSWYDFSPFGYNIVETHFARGPQYTFAHEVGHNLGSAHNRAAAQNAGAFDFSYGFQQPGEFYTLMSYSGGCGGCTPVNAWSNPNVNINGKPTGATGANSADNARSLRETAPLAESFRDSVSTPPPPPPPPNGVPTANPQSVTTPYETSKSITLSGSDPDGDPLTYSIVSQPSKGSLSGSGRNRTYHPNNGVSGSDSFVFRVSDGNGGTDDATVSITVQAPAPPPAVLVSEVVVVNGVSDQSWTTVSLSNQYESPVVVCTAAYERTASPAVPRVRNAAGSSFQVRLSSPGAAGVSAPVHCLIVNEGVYTFAENGIKLEAVRYNSTATDHDASWSGQARSYQQSYSNPVVLGQVMSYNDSRFSVFWARGASATAPPSSSTLRLGKHVAEDSATSRSGETVGYVVVESGAGSLGSISYQAGVGADSVFGIVDSPPYTYSLSSINDVEAVVASSAGMDGVNGGWPVIYGANGASGSNLRFAIDEDVIGDPERNHTSEQVAYMAFGSATPVGEENNPPTANAQSVTTAYQTAKAITLTASDPDGDPLGYQLTSSPSHGSLSGAAPNITYTPNAGYSGPDSFTFQVNDGRGGVDSATVSITVQSGGGGGGNNPPIANPGSATVQYETNKWIRLDASDPDGDPLTYRLVDWPDHGGITGTAPNHLFWPEKGYSGPDRLVYEVDDGRGGTAQAEFTFTILGPAGGNNPPIANPGSATVEYETNKWIRFDASDPDGDPLTYRLVDRPDHGGITGTAPNQLFWPEKGYSGPDRLVYEVDDGRGGTAQAEFTFDILPPAGGNNPPIANPGSATVEYETNKWIRFDASDPDGDPLTYRLVDWPDHGGITGTAPNQLFWPEKGYSGPDRLVYEVDDGRGGTAQAEFTFNILPPAGGAVHIERHTVVAGSSWKTIQFNAPFDSPVAVCTAQYSDTNASAMIRTNNVSSNSMRVRVHRVSSSGSGTAQAHCLVAEEGVYTQAQHGIKMEAVKFVSTVTDRSGSWTGQVRSYQQNYSNPVVVGQVMTSLSLDYTAFWAGGSSAASAPSSSVLRVGKHVGEDSRTWRPNETIGYIVMESGAGTVAGINYAAGVGGTTVRGLDDSPPYSYSLPNSNPTRAVASSAGMIGGDGGFPVILDPGVSGGSIRLAIAEDQLGDSERIHTAERVAYIAFD